MLTYEDARATVSEADQDPFILPSYTGGPTDLAYLKDWVLDQVETIYDVSADIFDEATLYSTSILRDFVHRAIYDETGYDSIDQIAADGGLQFPQNSDVATAFRYPAYGLCGLAAWQEYQVFRAFGYQTTEIAIFNGNVSDSFDSHVTTEIYLTDLNQWIVQDATYNFLIQDSDGNYLSFDQARKELYGDDGELTYNSFNDYSLYPYDQTYETTFDSSLKGLFDTRYFKVPYWIYDTDGTLDALAANLFRTTDLLDAHNPSADQGQTFGAVAYAQEAFDRYEAQHLDWSTIGRTLYAGGLGYYVSGFALTDDTGNITSHWITIRLSDGDYMSYDIDHHAWLNGSYDQLADETTGGVVLNPNSDLSGFLNPVYLMDYTGTVEDGFVSATSSPPAYELGSLLLRNVNSGLVELWDITDGALNNGNTISPTSDTGFKIAGYGGDYVGDGQHDILFYKASSGQVGFWNENAAWTSLGTMSGQWKIASSDHSDFDGTGTDDILWHNQTTAQVGYWQIDNGQNTGFTSLGGVSASQWHVAATADFNGDGTDDILWQNNTTAELREWTMQNGQIEQNFGLWGQVNSSVIGTADIMHDGSVDILWENSTTHEVGFWDMMNGQNTGYQSLGVVNDDWSVVAIRDMTADGTDDIVWQSSSGGLYLWALDDVHGHNQVATTYLGAHASDWIVA